MKERRGSKLYRGRKSLLLLLLTAALLLPAGWLGDMPEASAEAAPTADLPIFREVRVAAVAATASSGKTGHGPELALDGVHGDEANNWRPATRPTASNPQWIQLDLGRLTKVGALEAIVVGDDGPMRYAVQVSQDGSHFQTVAEREVQSSRTLFSAWDSLEARYVRMLVTDSFGPDSPINEIILFPDVLPHRVGILSCFPDMKNFGDAGLASLLNQHQQLMNLCVSIADPASPGINLMPELIDDALYPNGIFDQDVLDYVSNPANYSWEYADEMFKRFTDIGMDIWLGFQGFSSRAFPSFYSTIVDEIGRTIEHRDFFNELHNETVIEVAKQTMRHFDSNPNIRKFSILGPGWFGGIEYYSGHSPELLAVYSESAQTSFRSWLSDKYGTIGALNESWGKSYENFDEISSPLPNRSNADPVDDRPEWADLMFWKMEYMDDFLNKYMQEMRSVSDKQIHVEVDGGYQSAPMETGESMGKIARDFSKYDNIIFGNSNLDASYGVAQYAATARFYGLKGTMDDTAQPSDKAQTDNAFNFLSRGVDMLAHSALGWDYEAFNGGTGKWDPNGNYSGNDLYRFTEANAKKYLTIDPEPEGPDVLIFNPWYANLFRQGYNRNDHNFIFDGDHGISWFGAPFANWAHYLQSPDILDDFPIEDGALENYKVFISPNMGVTLTSDAAEAKIKSWVQRGGAIVSFGTDSFSYRLNLSDRRLEGGDEVDDWMMGMLAGSEATERAGTQVKVSNQAPAWLKSLAAGASVTVSAETGSAGKALSALPPNAAPVLEDEAGNVIMAEYAVGEGSVLFGTLPVADNAMFKDSFMSRLLSDYADSRGIKRTVMADPAKFHVADAGVDAYTGKRVIEVARNATTDPNEVLVIRNAPSLDGTEAIIDLNWEKDSVLEYTFESGKAFVYVPSADGVIAASGTITEEEGRQVVTLDLSNGYPVSSISLNAEKPLAALAFAADGFGSGWQKVGGAFSGSPVTAASIGAVASSAGAEGAVGKLVSKPFVITDDALAFYGAGYAGESGTGEQPAGEDKVIADFETGDWSELAYVDTEVFGASPAIGGAGWVSDRDGYYAASSTGGGQKGKLRTASFVIDRPTLAFDGAGWNGTVYGEGPWPYALNNRFYLKDAATDQILLEEVPTNRVGDSGRMKTYVWDVAQWAGKEVYFEAADAIGDEESAAYGGGFDWLAVDNVKLTGEPFQTEASVTGQNRFALKVIDGSVLRSAAPPNGEAYELIYWDVSNLKGRTVYMEAADGMDTAADGWLAFGAPFMFDHKDAVEDDYWSFESGTYADWEHTGDAFGSEPNSRYLGRPLGSGNGKYWADSLAAGEDKTGTMTSKPFVVDKPILSFLAAGWNGQAVWNPPRNYYELIDENGQRLRLATPPGQSSQPLNQFIAQYWDVSDLIGETVRFRVVDGDSGSGYAWLATDSIHLLDNSDFEMGSYASWQSSGTAFGAEPASLEHPTFARGARGKRWSDSSSGGATAAGTLTSAPLKLEGEWLSFLAAGFADGGANYYRLLTIDGQELDRVAPPNTADFVPLKLHAPGGEGTLVRFEAVDGSASEPEGWLSFDDLNERKLLPAKLKLRLSPDGAQWTEEVELGGIGATRLAYELPGGETYRYVQWIVEGGRVDAGFLRLLQLRQPVNRWTDGVMGSDGMLDLGQSRFMNGLKLQFATEKTRSFVLETSADGQIWSSAYKVIAQKGASVQAVFPAVSARYVKVAGLSSESAVAMTAQVVTPPELNLRNIPNPSDGTDNGGPEPQGPNVPGSNYGTPARELLDIDAVQENGRTTLSIRVQTKPEGNDGGAAAELTRAQWTALAKLAAEKLAEGQRVHVVVKVSAPEDVLIVNLRLPSGAMTALEKGSGWTLEVDFPAGRIRLNEEAMETLTAAAGQGSVAVSLTRSVLGQSVPEVQASSLASSESGEVYRFSVKANEQTMATFSKGKAEISVPYVLGDGKDMHAVVAREVGQNGARKALRGGFDASRSIVRFVTGELAPFAIDYNKVVFKDAPRDAWYGESAAYLAARGIILGNGAGIFAPTVSVTRADFLVMAMRAYGIVPKDEIGSSFDDAGSAYYTPYLDAAKRLGLVNGVGGNRFAPVDAMSRQDMLVILQRLLSRIGELPQAGTESAAFYFEDEAQISGYAREAVHGFAKAGVVTGYRNTIDPGAITSRAQAAQILYRLLRDVKGAATAFGSKS